MLKFLKLLFNSPVKKTDYSHITQWHLRAKCRQCGYHIAINEDSNSALLQLAGFEQQYLKWVSTDGNKNVCKGCGCRIIYDIKYTNYNCPTEGRGVRTTWKNGYSIVTGRAVYPEDNVWEFKE